MEKVKISDCCIITNGFAFKSDKYVDRDGARVIRITNVQKGKIVDNDPKFYPFDLLKNLDAYKIFEGDILMSLTGNVGRVGKFPKEMVPGYINQRICRIMPKDERLDVNYLFQLLNSDKFETEAMRNSSGAAQLNLSSKWLNNYEIPLPSLHIQKAIAAKLDKAQEIISYNQQLLEKYDQLTQSLFIDMFGDPVKNEKGWKKIKLGSLANISSGSTPSRTNESFYKGNIPWVKTGEVNGKIILDTKEKISQDALKRFSCKLYPKGSLIIAMYGQGKTRGQIGKLGIEATTNQACAVIPPSNKMNYEYLFTLLKFSYEDLRDLGRGGNQPNLNAGLVKNYEVINPPNVLQNEFAKRIEKIEIQKQMAQESLAKSEELFQSLLKESFQQ